MEDVVLQLSRDEAFSLEDLLLSVREPDADILLTEELLSILDKLAQKLDDLED